MKRVSLLVTVALMLAAAMALSGAALAKNFAGTDGPDFLKGTAEADLIRALADPHHTRCSRAA